MFSKILIANRGEIAVRIIRACKEMGISSVAVFSQADRESLHVSLADESICIGPAAAKESYLDMNRILSAAKATGAQAIHPGYGFLSENSQFAALCEKCGIVFIGPSSGVIEKMGDKNMARQTALSSGMPVIPGSEVIANEKDALTQAEKIGYPLLLKARSGGGGKGIRLAKDEKELNDMFPIAFREAQSAFGDGALYLEKYIKPAKHVEVQLLCDKHGAALCLGERECSVQLRRQKLMEESPSCAVDTFLREKMQEAALKIAKAVGYVGAGTVEFLVDEKKNFYFMEMNTRLQVEHPVTEMVTGIDLVKWQIRIAAGVPLSFTQDSVAIRGHAIECRINAKPGSGFGSTAGRISLLHVPGGPWVRFDTALYQGYAVAPFYDAMIGKLIVFAPTREEAIRKMQAALCELVIEGIDHNAELQMEILGDAGVKCGDYDTDFMEKRGY